MGKRRFAAQKLYSRFLWNWYKNPRKLFSVHQNLNLKVGKKKCEERHLWANYTCWEESKKRSRDWTDYMSKKHEIEKELWVYFYESRCKMQVTKILHTVPVFKNTSDLGQSQDGTEGEKESSCFGKQE